MASNDISPADRIRELNAVNGHLAAILHHAGQAVKALSPTPDPDDEASHLDARKKRFEAQSKDMFTSLQAATAVLRRQAYALEEAGIIAAQAPTISSHVQRQQSPQPGGGAAVGKKPEPDRITNGGMGNLDVGWLNSRGNQVGAEKEAELLEEATELARRALRDGRGMT